MRNNRAPLYKGHDGYSDVRIFAETLYNFFTISNIRTWFLLPIFETFIYLQVFDTFIFYIQVATTCQDFHESYIEGPILGDNPEAHNLDSEKRTLFMKSTQKQQKQLI